MRVGLIPVQDALQKTVLLKAHKDFSTEEFKLALEDVIKTAQETLIWLYSNNTSGYKRPEGWTPLPKRKPLQKFIIPREEDK